MSRTYMSFEVFFTVCDSEQLPPTSDGARMYDEDVSGELRQVVEAAVRTWYVSRGHRLLVHEPDVG